MLGSGKVTFLGEAGRPSPGPWTKTGVGASSGYWERRTKGCNRGWDRGWDAVLPGKARESQGRHLGLRIRICSVPSKGARSHSVTPVLTWGPLEKSRKTVGMSKTRKKIIHTNTINLSSQTKIPKQVSKTNVRKDS